MISRIRSLLAFALFAPFALAAATPKPIPVKVVVIAMFEVGADTGDQPGELQYWVERDHLDRVYPLPAGYHAVRMNDAGEMAVLTGQGTAHAASTIMALGLDTRFDLSHAYWIVAGIAGGCPDRISLASAAWAHWVVDTDLGYEIDAREIPPDWPTGYIPLRKTKPYEQPVAPLEGQVYELNAKLVDWAFNLTQATPLADSEQLKNARGQFDGAAASRPMKLPVRPSGTANFPMPGPKTGCATSPRAKGSSPPPAWKTPERCNRCAIWPTPGASIGIASWCCALSATSTSSRAE
jgi:purine nucleoside permease